MRYSSEKYNIIFDTKLPRNHSYLQQKLDDLIGKKQDYTRPIRISDDLADALVSIDGVPFSPNERDSLRTGKAGTLTF